MLESGRERPIAKGRIGETLCLPQRLQVHPVNTSNRFAPPKTPLEPAPGAPATRKTFPWLFVLRYVAGALILISGLISAYWLSRSWDLLVDRSIIAPLMSPYRLLPAMLLKVATGIAILAKRKESLVLTVLWAIALLNLLWSNGPLSNLGPDFYVAFALIIGLFAFQCLLLTRGLLR